MKIEVYDIMENLALMYEILGEEKFLEIIRMYGGSHVYIPTYKNVVRSNINREIAKKYNGINVSHLARKYGISVNQIKNIIDKE